MQGEVARKIPFCQNFPNKTEKIAKRAENRRAPIARAKTADTPLNCTGNGGKKTRPAHIPHPLAKKGLSLFSSEDAGMVQKFRRPRLSRTKDNAIHLTPAPLTAPKSGWPTPSVNRKARKKGTLPRILIPNYCQCYGRPIFPAPPFSAAPRDNFRRPCCDMQGRRTQRDFPPTKTRHA